MDHWCHLSSFVSFADDHEGTSKPSKNKIGENKGQKQAKKPKMQKVNKKKDLPVTKPIQVTLTRAMNGDQQNDFSTGKWRIIDNFYIALRPISFTQGVRPYVCS